MFLNSDNSHCIFANRQGLTVYTILSALASGKSESDIAKKYAVSWQERLSARRVEQGVPAQLLQKAFKLPYPGNVPSYADNKKGRITIRPFL
jgi:hypothetical protein